MQGAERMGQEAAEQPKQSHRRSHTAGSTPISWGSTAEYTNQNAGDAVTQCQGS